MNKKRKRRKYLTVSKRRRLMINITLLLILFIGLGYSVLGVDLNILGNIKVNEYMEPTLYNVLKKEAKINGLAREYTGEHHDSFTEEPSQKIYHWYAENDTEGTQVLDKNNVIFAGQCWQMIRTTDTGGVKMIYNGEAEDGKCLNTRGTHVGYVARTSQNLASNYWYGTDYTYDSVAKTFKVSGTTEQTTWNATTGPGLVGKYTCKLTSEDGSCSTLYLVESYYNTTSAYVIPLNSNSNYSQFGTLQFNVSYNSPTYVGYMYGDVYAYSSINETTSQSFTTTQTMLQYYSYNTNDLNYMYADSITYDSTIGKYSLVNPYQISAGDYQNLIGKYTFRSSSQTSTATNVYYIAEFSSGLDNYQKKVYYKLLEGGNLLSAYEPIVFGDSIRDNGDGTYTINNPTNVTLSDWYTDYANYKEKYTCNDSSTTCANPRYTTATSSTNYTYMNAGEKIMIGKTRNGLTLTDTILVRKDELVINSSNYSDYKYTCNTDSATCTEATLRMISGYSTTGYNYVPNHYYGSSVTWDGTNYTLVDPIEIENYNNMNNISTHHYMCVSNGLKTCATVAYVYYYTGSGTMYYITLRDGVTTVGKALEDMLTKNTTNSTLKSGVDAWYKHYLLKDYDDYIEDTIFCNDRSIRALNGWNPDGGMTNAYPQFKEYNVTSDLSCTNTTDKFSVSNNNAKSTYKVGLMSSPEMNILNNSNARKTGHSYWLASPDYFSYFSATVLGVVTDGSMYNYNVNNAYGVRPAVSLTPGTRYSDGDGSMANPYYVGEMYNITSSSNLVPKESPPDYTVTLGNEEYAVRSFKLDGTLVNGDSFVMPHHDVTITDVQSIPAYYTITSNDSDINVPERGRYGSTIELTSDNYRVDSFKLNGTLITGNSFVMPGENVTITDIQKTPKVIVESEHNPYANSIDNVTYYENTFAEATSLTVELTYQTESTSYDWIYLYDSADSTTPFNNKKYGGTTQKTETLTIPSNYLKIVFRTDSSGNNYYGFKAVITPNYD